MSVNVFEGMNESVNNRLGLHLCEKGPTETLETIKSQSEGHWANRNFDEYRMTA